MEAGGQSIQAIGAARFVHMAAEVHSRGTAAQRGEQLLAADLLAEDHSVPQPPGRSMGQQQVDALGDLVPMGADLLAAAAIEGAVGDPCAYP